MIGRDDDQRAIELARRAQIRQQLADHRVGVGHLRVVRLVLRGVRLGGAIGFVGIVEVDPGEPLRIADCGLRIRLRIDDPRGCRPDHVFRAPLCAFRGIAGRFLAVPIVVDVEPAVQAEARVEDEGADERARPVAGALEHGGQRRQLRAEPKQAVGAEAVHRRRHGRQDGCVRGKRQRRGAVRAREPEAFGCELVEVRGEAGAAAERADPIEAQRVDRDEEHVAAAAGT